MCLRLATLCTLWLGVLVLGGHGQSSSGQTKGCPLKSGMDINSCFTPSHDNDVTELQDDSADDTMVADGTVCPLGSSMFKCRKRLWFRVDPSSPIHRSNILLVRQTYVSGQIRRVNRMEEPAYSLAKTMEQPTHSLQKRSLNSCRRNLCRHCRRHCRRWWFSRRCSTRCYVTACPNTPPCIQCPYIPPKNTISRGMNSKIVTWDPATAYDPEQGALSTRQTQGPTSGSKLDSGTYVVSYIATDMHGASRTCTVTFSVEYRMCSGFPWYILNGRVNCSNYLYDGSMCTFSCRTGYKLEGSPISQCLTHQWSDPFPRCELTKCSAPAAVENGEWVLCAKPTYGSKCYLLCDNGYESSSTATITCVDNSTWTNPGSCKDTTPPSIQCPADVNVAAGPKMAAVPVTWTKPLALDNSGDPVTWISNYNSGGLFSPGQTEVRYTVTDSSSNQATCSFVITVEVGRCGALQSPSNGQPVSCSHEDAVGSTCTFSCVSGFDLVGSASLTCDENKLWDTPVPECRGVVCGSPPSVGLHGRYNCSEGQSFQDSCTQSCDHGYQAMEPVTITCQADRQWTALGSCEDKEPPRFPDGCPDILDFAAAVGQKTYVTYNKPQAVDTSGGQVTVTSTPASGTEFPIGINNVTAKAEDEAGNVKTCIFRLEVRQRHCHNPSNTDLDPSQKMEFTCPDGYVYGAECHLSCSDHNPVQGGVESIKCLMNGTHSVDWQWNGNSKPYCQEHTCPKANAPFYGAVACDTFTTAETCVVTCNDQYAYSVTDLRTNYFICFKSTGLWVPYDIKNDTCKDGTRVRNVEMEADVFYYSGSCPSNLTYIKEKFLEIVDKYVLLISCEIYNCTIDTVTVECGARSKRSLFDRILRSTLTHKTVVVFSVTMSYEDQGSVDATTDHFDSIINQVNDKFYNSSQNGDLDIPAIGAHDTPSYGNGRAAYMCSPPLVYSAKSGVCVPCGPGFRYNQDTTLCTACPVGTYQPDGNSYQCISCPNGSTTHRNMSTSIDSCLSLCHAGTFSRSGRQPCEACDRGTYQTQTGKTGCLPCDYGMWTSGQGSQFVADCQFYDVTLSAATTDIKLSPTSTLPVFTVLTWVKVPSDLLTTKTTFSLGQRQGATSIGCGGYRISVQQTEETSGDRRNYRQWYHLALVGSEDEVLYLYEDGQLIDQQNRTGLALCTDLQLHFSPGAVQTLIVSGLQMSEKNLTAEEVTSFASSCTDVLPGNILKTNDIADLLVTPSTCDAEDGCANDPCGRHGACTDTMTGYECSCDPLWTGTNCEIEPDFCNGHQCLNGAECINHAEQGNYTCNCTEEFRGMYCTEPIVHGNWSMWSLWTVCTVSCGRGQRSRTRLCNNPAPGPDGRDCHGVALKSEECSTHPCPVHGNVSEWSEWTCAATCGNAVSTRERKCDNPSPAYGGNNCTVPLEEFRDCQDLPPCPIDGEYGSWSLWSTCSVTCAGGVSQRNRTCDSPAPQHGGQECNASEAEETVTCNTQDCPTCSNLRRHYTHSELECSTDEGLIECNITCKPGYVLEEQTFSCGPSTDYIWSHVSELNPDGILPSCMEATLPNQQTFETTVDIAGSSPADKDAVAYQVKENMKTTMGCDDCDIKVTSALGTKPGRKRSSDYVIKLVIEVKRLVTLGSVDLATASAAELDKIVAFLDLFDEGLARFANNTESILSVNIGGVEFKPDLSSLDPAASVSCGEGMEELDGICASCAAGTYWSDGSCLLCTKGAYQDLAKQKSCKLCPLGTSTAGTGTKSPTDCVTNPTIFVSAYPLNEPASDPSTGTSAAPLPVSIGPKQSHGGEEDNKLMWIGASVGAVIALGLFLGLALVVYMKKGQNQKWLKNDKVADSSLDLQGHCHKASFDSGSETLSNNAFESPVYMSLAPEDGRLGPRRSVASASHLNFELRENDV